MSTNHALDDAVQSIWEQVPGCEAWKDPGPRKKACAEVAVAIVQCGCCGLALPVCLEHAQHGNVADGGTVVPLLSVLDAARRIR